MLRRIRSRRTFTQRLRAIAAGAIPRSLNQGLALRMPGEPHRGPLPPFTPGELALAAELRRDVEELAGRIGERNVYNPAKLRQAEAYLENELTRAGLQPRRQTYRVLGVDCTNFDAEVRGTEKPDEIVVLGAHYDALHGTTAANDNASGVAAVLALARRCATGGLSGAAAPAGATAPKRTLRFALFMNEEPPFFWTDQMGSLVYARACKARGENIVAMLTPETIGYYSDEPRSQHYPIPVPGYPTQGNFILFAGMYEARALVRRCVGTFRRECPFPCYGAAATIMVPWIGASDHWSFWKQDYPALMITDTAPLRYPHYHTPQDTPDKIDDERTARVVTGIGRVLDDLLNR
ncbi:MAG: M28 family peptidase [Phycisphaerales bacterium]